MAGRDISNRPISTSLGPKPTMGGSFDDEEDRSINNEGRHLLPDSDSGDEVRALHFIAFIGGFLLFFLHFLVFGRA